MYNLDNDNEHTKEVDIKSVENNMQNKKSVVAGEEVVLDENDDINKKEKKKISKKIIIGIICIIVVVLCVVIYSVLNSNNQNKEELNLEDETALISSTSDTYEGLNYSVEKTIIEQTGFFYDYSRNLEGNKIEVSYQKIDGLKDNQLEEKINNLLMETAKELYTNENVQNSNILYDHIYNYTDVYIFNNVLSTLYCREICDTNGNTKYEYKGININLNDFTKIDIKDIFINTADITNIMSEKMLSAYNSENFEFSVSPKFVYIPLEDGTVDKINLYENKDVVAIYKRYSSNTKMFEKTYNATPYVFTTKKFIETDLYGLVEDNMFVDTYDTLVNTNYSDGVKEAIDFLYKDAINRARNTAFSNPSNRYLVQVIPSVKETENKTYEITVEYNIYQMDKQFFNEQIVDFVVSSENKADNEIEQVQYFNNPTMEADKYLEDSKNDILKLEVNSNGEDVTQLNQSNTSNNMTNNMGIS